MEIKTMKTRGFDQNELGKRLIAAKTDSLNQSMKEMIEMQKNIDNTYQQAGNEQLAGLLQ
jgi:hypothetical protein